VKLTLIAELQNITAPWPVPNYTSWWQRYTGVSSLPKAATRWCPARTRTRDRRIDALQIAQIKRTITK